ncbi:MAG: histidine kinase dimerization/phospho-acceptor domain-containing protein, partial [Thermoplasmata archaeon]
ITLINSQGVVLADSQHDPETMENHAHRPEIMQAYQGRVGTSLRHSATLNRDLCYLAVPLTYRGRPGYVLRLAVPLEDLDVAIRAVRWRILGTSLVVALIALAIAYVFSRSFTRRIKRLRAFAEGLAEERGSGALAPQGHDELGALAGSLNRMGAQLRGLIERLSLESTRRQAILSSMVEGVLAVDGDLRVTFCNDSFARTVGARLPVAEGTPLLDLVRDPGLKEMLSHVLSTGQSVNERLHLAARTTSNGQVFEIQAAPLAGPSRRGAIAILHDITDLERLERVRKDFVANVSHELRTPLTAIRGYAETLLDGGLEDQASNRRFVEVIHTHSTRLGNIAADLLTLSDLESGKPAPEPERIS